MMVIVAMNQIITQAREPSQNILDSHQHWRMEPFSAGFKVIELKEQNL